jgi:hypothetical protein
MILHLLLAATLAADPALDPQTVTYADLPEDSGTYTPWSETPATPETDPFAAEAVREFRRRLAVWAPAQAKDPRAAVEACLALTSLVDAARHPVEFDAPAILLTHLQARIPREALVAALTRVALRPGECMPLTEETAFEVAYPEVQDLRDRMAIYARKMLGRVLGRLPVR